jgi:hypothetical protein
MIGSCLGPKRISKVRFYDELLSEAAFQGNAETNLSAGMDVSNMLQLVDTCSILKRDTRLRRT